MKHKVTITLISIIFCLILSTGVLAFEAPGDIHYERSGDYAGFRSDTEIRPVERAKIEQDLPSQYDLRDVNGTNYVTPVKLQNPWGCCWSFAALSAAESNALLKGAPNNIDLSERALAWYTFQLQGAKGAPESDYEGFTVADPADPSAVDYLPFNAGGNQNDAITQLASWNGTSTEADAPYQNDEGNVIFSPLPGVTEYSPYGTWSLPYDDIYDNNYHLQNAYTVSTGGNYEPDAVAEYTDEAKQLILDEGGLLLGFGMYDNDSTCFNQSTWSEYVPEEKSPNHAVCIVGWDDDYAVSNFATEPPGPGAWICKNNWSSAWGLDGYFYVSYYDQTINGFSAFDIELPDDYSYDNNLQYDFTGNKGALGATASNQLTLYLAEQEQTTDDVRVASVFDADKDQTLDAVSFQSTIGTNSEVTTSIYLLNDGATDPEDGKLMTTQIDQFNMEGFNTIKLNTPVPLSAGQKFSVVQTIGYELETEEGGTITAPGVPLEYGLKEPFSVTAQNRNNQQISAEADFDVTINPDESYVYGVNSDSTPVWTDLSDPELREFLEVDVSSYLDSDGATAVPGNAMIKAFTSDSKAPVKPATSITITDESGSTPDNIYLTPSDAGTNSINLNATLKPAGSDEPIFWTVEDDAVATLSNVLGPEVTLTGNADGETIISAVAGDATAEIPVTVSGDDIIVGELTVENPSPDYFTLVAQDVVANPALGETDEVQKVSMFCWSAPDQSDMNAKVASRTPGTNDWVYENFPVNDNDPNTFFINADNIIVNVYASTDKTSDGVMIGSGTYSWVDGFGQNALGYIGYSQNIGFDRPTVYSGVAGTTDEGLNLEGFRISSDLEGVEINTRVHVQNIGWMDPVSDGSYAGTMHQNLGIEAIELYLTGENASDYQIQYRVLQENNGWQNWIWGGQLAGSTGRDLQLEAIEVQIVPI